jgi:hypothetical protein
LEGCGKQPDLPTPDSGRGAIPLFGRLRLGFERYQPAVPIAALAGLVVAIACGAFAVTNPLIGFLLGYVVMALVLGLAYAVNA